MPLGKHRPTRTLRDQPDLSQLRRQAKELLKAFTAGGADASRKSIAATSEPPRTTLRCTARSMTIC